MTWRIECVEDEPTRTLEAWMVFEVPFDGAARPWTRHLVGWRMENGKGQVSSPVEKFDPVSRRTVTRSGRVYELGERPGLNADAFATWNAWKHINKIHEELDVTDAVETLLSDARLSGQAFIPTSRS